MQKVVVITGASSGIGLSLVKKYLLRGAIVYGIGKDPCPIKGVKYLKVDVLNLEAYDKALSLIKSNTKHIDVLINNVGIGISGPTENLTPDIIKKQMDTNFTSHVYTTNALLPLIKVSNEKKIVFISSVGADFPLPFQSIYSASKAAINAYASALRCELKPLNIKVSVFAPGDVNTNFTKSRLQEQATEEYEKNYKNSLDKQEAWEKTGLTSDYVADFITSKLDRKNPPFYSVIGSKYKFFNFLKGFLTKQFISNIMYKLYSKLPRENLKNKNIEKENTQTTKMRSAQPKRQIPNTNNNLNSDSKENIEKNNETLHDDNVVIG